VSVVLKAEDGIGDWSVTGVQTCALPILTVTVLPSRLKYATEQGKESIKRDGNTVTVTGTVVRSHFTPDVVRVKEGDKVVFNWTKIGRASCREGVRSVGMGVYVRVIQMQK